MSEMIGLNEQQRTVIDESTALAILSGFASRYHKELRINADRWGQTIELLDGPSSEALKPKVALMRDAVVAEVPTAFSLEPSSMAVSVKAIKVNPDTGEEIPHSSVQVGLVGGLAGDGSPSGDFEDSDLEFAVQRLREQKTAQLTYGLSTGSGFLADY